MHGSRRASVAAGLDDLRQQRMRRRQVVELRSSWRTACIGRAGDLQRLGDVGRARHRRPGFVGQRASRLLAIRGAKLPTPARRSVIASASHARSSSVRTRGQRHPAAIRRRECRRRRRSCSDSLRAARRAARSRRRARSARPGAAASPGTRHVVQQHAHQRHVALGGRVLARQLVPGIARASSPADAPGARRRRARRGRAPRGRRAAPGAALPARGRTVASTSLALKSAMRQPGRAQRLQLGVAGGGRQVVGAAELVVAPRREATMGNSQWHRSGRRRTRPRPTAPGCDSRWLCEAQAGEREAARPRSAEDWLVADGAPGAPLPGSARRVAGIRARRPLRPLGAICASSRSRSGGTCASSETLAALLDARASRRALRGQLRARCFVAARRLRDHLAGIAGAGGLLVPGLAVDAHRLEPVAHELLVVARRVLRPRRSLRPASSATNRASAPRPSASACPRRRGRTRTWCRR